jgi:hypothetical protein
MRVGDLQVIPGRLFFGDFLQEHGGFEEFLGPPELKQEVTPEINEFVPLAGDLDRMLHQVKCVLEILLIPQSVSSEKVSSL